MLLSSQEKHVTGNIRECRKRRKLMNLFLRHWSVEPSQLILVERKKKIRTSLCWRKYCVSMEKNGAHFIQFSGPNTAPSNTGQFELKNLLGVQLALNYWISNKRSHCWWQQLLLHFCDGKKENTIFPPCWRACACASCHECSRQNLKKNNVRDTVAACSLNWTKKSLNLRVG